ncbi:MbcA/ParS/Xre antitoxin family protein [Rheinheimera sp. A13L]|uniref:MbcA/ParS/Xre antitoxin family protein n=1 Tax=Rheinheimera sp. A13L TaxID=506534 RepID=UPI0002D33D5D|nr:MbcA/ParS/Xre antitoxin family protein [Rheinheimera sp. A13L]
MMSANTEAVLQQDPEKTAQVALSVFFNIMNAWQVKAKDQMVLLGKPAESTFYNWKKGKIASLSPDTLERISYVMGIYKALGILFASREQADAWPQKPNAAFNNETALDFMLKGSVMHLSDMRRYLDAQRG